MGSRDSLTAQMEAALGEIILTRHDHGPLSLCPGSPCDAYVARVKLAQRFLAAKRLRDALPA